MQALKQKAPYFIVVHMHVQLLIKTTTFSRVPSQSLQVIGAPALPVLEASDTLSLRRRSLSCRDVKMPQVHLNPGRCRGTRVAVLARRLAQNLR